MITTDSDIVHFAKKLIINHPEILGETCGMCLEDGRGTCAEQLQEAIRLYEKLRTEQESEG